MTTTTSGAHREILQQSLQEIRRLRAQLAAHSAPAAVLGAAVRMPAGIEDLHGYWSALRDGVDAVTELLGGTDGRRGPGAGVDPNGRYGGLLSTVDSFDAEFFGISPAEAERMDPQQRLVLEVAWEAIEDAGLTLDTLRTATTGVFIGVYGSDYLMMQVADSSGVNAYTAPGGVHSIVANRLSYVLDLSGPSMAVDTACSSSLMALHLAVRALRDGDCDIALVGGVNTILSPVSTTVTEKVLPLAPRGRCRAFDASAEGIVRAEGCGMVVLTRESFAAAGAQRPRAVIRGTAVNHDGRTNGLTAPSPRAQTDLLRRALRDANAEPDDVVYIESHGTGTPLGDPIEFDAIRTVYGAGSDPCPVGAVKTNFGHQEAAAGIAGLIKAILVLEHDEAPANLHLERVNPEIDLTGTRLLLPQAPTPLADRVGPKLAAVSSFGFGGANVHTILESRPRTPADTETEHPDSARADRGTLILPISARSAPAARALAARYAEQLAEADVATAVEICAAAATRRSHLPVRLCLTGATAEELAQRAGSATALSRPKAAPRQRTLFVFSGQGSQWAEMGRALYAEPVAAAELEACEVVVAERAGWSLRAELLAGPADSRLERTDIAQICIAAVEFALTALWRSWGVAPAAVVGHSMGEVVAAAVAGMLTREQAFDILVRRAVLTEKYARGGAMCAVALPADDVAALLDPDSGVGIAAVNGPRSTVITGPAAAVDTVAAAASARAAEVRRLPVDYAFHSTLLAPCAEEFADQLAEITASTPTVPVYSTVTGQRVSADQLSGQHWARNLVDTVLFAPAVSAALRADSTLTTVLEVGPHPVLIRDLAAVAAAAGRSPALVASLRRGRSAADSLHRSLADLYVDGHDITWNAVLDPPGVRVDLPHYPWVRRRYWLPEHIGKIAHTHPVDGATDVREPSAPAPLGRDAHADRPAQLQALTEFVRERIARALQRPIAEIDESTPIREFGLESLVVVEMKNELEAESGILVPLHKLLEVLDRGSARDLAAVIIGADTERP